MLPAKRGDRIQVHIDRLSVGGRGVARHEGLVIFVEDTAPDEDVEIELITVKKNFAEGRLLKVAKASPYRVTPPCPVAGICGGCSWQHVSYDEQLRQKRSLVQESLRKFSGFETEVLEVVASPKEFRYRNRIQLHYAGPRMGFYKRGSHDIVDIEDCPITEEIVAAQIPRLKREFAHAKTGRIELLLSSDGSVGTRNANVDSRVKEGTDVADTAGPAFSQVNTAQNVHLIQEVIERTRALGGSSTIYDLYAGSGNFTFPLAEAFPDSQLVAVEFNHESVVRGQERVERERKNIAFNEGDVAAFLQDEDIDANSIVVLDPPRTGCGPDVMSALIASKVRSVIYVSCHPVTLARDLRAMKEAGYSLVNVRPFDMFPQTDHVETVVQLTLA